MSVYNSNECSVCLSKLKNNKKRTLKCGHQFHNKCINKCLTKTNNCPICRNVIIGETKKDENIKWINAIFHTSCDKYTKLFCKIENYKKNVDYKISNIFFNDNIEYYEIYHPELENVIMINIENINFNDRIGLYENNVLISCYKFT